MDGNWRTWVFFGIVISCILSCPSEMVRQRGVSPMLANFYDPSDVFLCLDGAKVVKYSQVNDDYCDCHDGSDEPGTNACDAGVFHCLNSGYHFKDISSSRVDDGICDCCDGTDERNSMVRCVMNCNDLGKQELNQIKIRTEIARKGMKLKYEMEGEGKNLKIEYDKRLIELEQKKKELELLVDAKTQLKNEVEKLEQEAIDSFNKKKQNFKTVSGDSESDAAFAELDVDLNGLIDITDLQGRTEFDSDQDGFISVEEAQFLMQGHENINKNEFENIWPKVKHYLSTDTASFVPYTKEQDLNHEETKESIAEIESTKNGETSSDKFDASDENFPGADSDEDNIEYDTDTQGFIKEADRVRDDLHKTSKLLEDVVTELQSVEKWMQMDYGDEWEFAILNGKCFSFVDREYTYKFCPFESTSQKQNVGGVEISLGVWSGWSDNETKYREMQYKGGASCWNGPQRSAKVKFECGLEQIVTSVLEPIRCEYEFIFVTPAVCNVTVGVNDFHDEL